MSNDPENHDVSGNNGEHRGVTDEYPTKHPKTAERMERTAMRRRWNIKDEYKDGMIQVQVQTALGGSRDDPASYRERTSAFRAILSAESQNQADELAGKLTIDQVTPESVAEQVRLMQQSINDSSDE